MKVQVTVNNVKIIEPSILNGNEYNIHECEFEFTEEYNGLSKKAIFTNEAGAEYVVSIVNNKCSIPSEVLKEKEFIKLGVYAYDVENEELIVRYSPRPTEFYIQEGSYKNAGGTPPTPSEIEQLQSQITHNRNDIDELQQTTEQHEETIQTINENINLINENIGDLQEEQVVQNTNIKKNTDDIVNINQAIDTINIDITNIDSAIGDINEDIDNLEQDLTNYSLITETGSQINLNVNSTNYQITATLKDKNGNVIYTSNAIDLPIESMIVNASYDKTTKEIVLTLQNGNTLRISIADLVSGLVSETQLQTILANYYTKAQVDNLLSAKANQSSLNQTNQNVTDLTERVSTNETDISAIKTEQTTQNTNIEELQTQVETLQEDLESANSEIAELNTDITNMRKAMITVEGQGTDITLENTSENKLVEFGLEGRTEQTQLEGYNLLEVTRVYEQTTLNGVTFKTNSDGTITLNGTATANMDVNFMETNPLTEIELEANQNYILSKKIISGSANRIMIAYKFDGGSSTTFTTDVQNLNSSENVRKLQAGRIFVNNGDVFNNVTVGIMLLKGSTDKNWEPYCEGIPAPNSGYEIPIKNVTGNASEKIQNRNLFVAQKIVEDSNSNEVYLDSDGNVVFKTHATMKIKPSILKNNTAYTFKLNVKSNSNSQNNIRFSINYTDGTSANVAETGLISDTNVRTLIFSSNSNKTIDYITATFTYNAFATLIVDGSMILEGSYTTETMPSYVEHQEQNYPFTFAEGQRGMQGTQLKDDGRHNARRQVILNGTENWLLWSNPSSSDYIIFYMYSTIFSKAKSNGALLCNYFKKGTYGDFSKEGIAIQYSGDYNCSIVIRKSQLSSLDASGIKQWLSTHNLLVEFELSEEAQKTEIIPYNATQQAQYNARKEATSCDDITYISSESDELGFNMNVVAVANANKVIDTQNNEIDTIKSRLDLLEG